MHTSLTVSNIHPSKKKKDRMISMGVAERLPLVNVSLLATSVKDNDSRQVWWD